MIVNIQKGCRWLECNGQEKSEGGGQGGGKPGPGQRLVVKHPETCIVVYPYSPGREPGCT